jgi:hypothetical protein
LDLGGVRVSDRNWVAEFRRATSTFNWVELADLSEAYVESLYRASVLPTSVPRVLQILRQNRRYQELESVADAALAHDVDVAGVRRQYAQALVDGGRPAVALRLYAELANDERVPEPDRIEAYGGIGRCYKELFLACKNPERRREYLHRAVRAYLDVYRQDEQRTWHGINAVALLARAGRDNIEFAPDVVGRVEDLARTVLDIVDAAPIPDSWSEVVASEALIGLGRYTEAVERAEAFLETGPAAATIASFHGQLRNVWQLDTTMRPGAELLPMLRSALLSLDGGQVDVEADDVHRARLADLGHGRLEKVLGSDRYQSLTWYRSGLTRCRAVAQLQTIDKKCIGAGVVVAGSNLHPDLPPLVLITSGHIIPEEVHPDDARAVFHGYDDESHRSGEFRIARLWWYEPSQSPGLDIAILELSGYPADVSPAPLADTLPRRPLRNQRVYVIAQTGGLSQPRFILKDNILLDHDNRVLHYRSRAGDGSSGSPVFDGQWHLLGVHRSGGGNVLQLNNVGGTYAASEAIAVTAVRERLIRKPPKVMNAPRGAGTDYLY